MYLFISPKKWPSPLKIMCAHINFHFFIFCPVTSAGKQILFYFLPESTTKKNPSWDLSSIEYIACRFMSLYDGIVHNKRPLWIKFVYKLNQLLYITMNNLLFHPKYFQVLIIGHKSSVERCWIVVPWGISLAVDMLSVVMSEDGWPITVYHTRLTLKGYHNSTPIFTLLIKCS